MRPVILDAVIRGTSADTVFDKVIQFDRYPELAPHVQSATVQRTWPEPTGQSTWELHFRSGLLRWTEQERYFRDELRISFQQTAGDFDEFTGAWLLRQEGADTVLRFAADFDFGIPSLAGILDPIAERVIQETIAWVLVGLFDDVQLDAQLDLAASVPGE
jgi:ribosome-associated toxin RatA of RatAB toxin-antitoxin module